MTRVEFLGKGVLMADWKKPVVPGPSVKHEFVPPRDERSGLAIAAAHYNASQAGQLAMVDATMRPPRCAFPGCNKLRDDPIHE